MRFFSILTHVYVCHIKPFLLNYFLFRLNTTYIMNPGIPIFPTMTPNIVNRLWFSVDEPRNEDNELIQIETAHQTWVKSDKK